MLRWLRKIQFRLIDRLDMTNADERFRQRKARQEPEPAKQVSKSSNAANDQGDTQ
jgi:hypothetical protein